MWHLLNDNEGTLYTLDIRGKQPAPEGGMQECSMQVKVIYRPFDDIIEGKQLDADLLKDVVRDWAEVYDADGNVLPFSDENLTLLCKNPYLVRAIIQEYFAFSSGLPAKNFDALPGPGSAAPAQMN